VELIGVYLAACLLLVAAGVGKALRPDDTARALAAVSPGVPGTPSRPGPRFTRRLVRVGAAAEAGLGLAGLVVLDAGVAGAVALSYAAFAVYVAAARRRGGALTSCGCFGTPDTPATRLHVVADLGLAAAALAVAVAVSLGDGARLAGTTSRTSPYVAGVLGHGPWHGLPLAFAAVACAWTLFHVLSTLPRLQAARHAAAGSG